VLTRGLPRIYPIADARLLQSAGIVLADFGRALYAQGMRFLQYRDKENSDTIVVENARILRRIFPPGDALLILNDRVHLFAQTGFDGVHVGQEDVSPLLTRKLIGPQAILGVSTHTNAQVEIAETMPADYIAIGPVFATQSKAKPDPVVGLEGVAAARARTHRPLVAIGGIQPGNAKAVFASGADSVAVISAFIPRPNLNLSETIARVLECS